MVNTCNITLNPISRAILTILIEYYKLIAFPIAIALDDLSVFTAFFTIRRARIHNNIQISTFVEASIIDFAIMGQHSTFTLISLVIIKLQMI